MAKNEDRIYSDAEKCDYYKKRANDPKLSEKQRDHARRRLDALCGKSSNVRNTKPQAKNSSRTSGQIAAYGAGVAYGAAKAGARVPVQPENQDSFRDGVKRGKQMARKPRVTY